jgi:hypothetical protein
MDKKSKSMDRVKVLIKDWIDNSKHYDPHVRNILMHPEMIKTYVQISMNNPVTPWKGVPEPEIIEEELALVGFAKANTIYSYGIEDDVSFMDRVRSTVIKFLGKLATSSKVRMYLHCEMLSADNDIKEAEFRSGSEIILKDGVNDLDELYDNAKERMSEEMQNYVSMGSGWVIHRVAKLVIHTTEYKPLGGCTYVELPEFIKAKKAVINMKNTDSQCFKWSITRALYPVQKNAERVTKLLQQQAQQIHWDGIQFPTALYDRSKFEKLNKNIALNVFHINGNYFDPLWISTAPSKNPNIT